MYWNKNNTETYTNTDGISHFQNRQMKESEQGEMKLKRKS